MKITLSKSQWEMIGSKAGWIKKAGADLPQLELAIEQFTWNSSTRTQNPIVGRGRTGGITEDTVFEHLRAKYPDTDTNLIWKAIRTTQQANPQQQAETQQQVPKLPQAQQGASGNIDMSELF